MIERRRHFVYVTRTGEYHLRDGICVAVRRPGETSFALGHLCVERALASTAKLGAGLAFDGYLVTTPVLEVRRPARRDVDLYAASA